MSTRGIGASLKSAMFWRLKKTRRGMTGVNNAFNFCDKDRTEYAMFNDWFFAVNFPELLVNMNQASVLIGDRRWEAISY